MDNPSTFYVSGGTMDFGFFALLWTDKFIGHVCSHTRNLPWCSARKWQRHTATVRNDIKQWRHPRDIGHRMDVSRFSCNGPINLNGRDYWSRERNALYIWCTSCIVASLTTPQGRKPGRSLAPHTQTFAPILRHFTEYFPIYFLVIIQGTSHSTHVDDPQTSCCSPSLCSKVPCA